MHFTIVTFVGLLAELLLIISQIPQIYKSFKTKSTEDLSLASIVCIISGILLWTISGLLKKEYVIIVSNIASLLVFSIVLYAKIKFS